MGCRRFIENKCTTSISFRRVPSLRGSIQFPLNHPRHPLRSLAQCRVVEMDVAIVVDARRCPSRRPATCRLSPVHDRVRGMAVPQVVKPRIRHDPGHVARPGPEPVESPIGQRSVPVLAGEHPLPGSRIGEAGQQRPRRLAEQNVPRTGLGVNQGEPVGLDLAPAQTAYLPGLHPVSRSRRTAATQTGFSPSRRRRTAPSFARSSAPSSRPRGGRR